MFSRAAFTAVFLAGCYQGLPGAAPFAELPEETAQQAPMNSLILEVVDADGVPVASADVQIGSRRLVTDGAGHLLLRDILTSTLVASVEAEDHAPSVLRAYLGAQAEHAQRGARVVLARRGEAFAVAADEGGVVESDDLRLVVPAGAFVDARGELVTGEVGIRFARGGGMAVAPLALDDPEGELGASLWGAVEIDVRWNGEAVTLAPGVSLQLTLDAPTELAGATPQVFSMARESLRWDHEGPASASPTASSSWTMNLDQLGWWGLGGAPGGERSLALTLVDVEGVPLGHAPLAVEGVAGQALGLAYTDASGRASLRLPAVGTWSIYPGLPGTPIGAAQRVGGDTIELRAELRDGDRCTPGAFVECGYGADPVTANVGLCAASRRFCGGLGTWFECEGEVLPRTESCGDARDEDCDGQLNESGDDCACDPGAVEACYTGDQATLGVGSCVGGTRTCVASGLRWGGCDDEQLPALTEMCADAAQAAADDDCDGTPACGGVERTWRYAELDTIVSVAAGSEDAFYVAGGDVANGALTVLRQERSAFPAWQVTLADQDGWRGAHLAPVAGDGGVFVAIATDVDTTRLVPISRGGEVGAEIELAGSADGLVIDASGRPVLSGTFVDSLDLGSPEIEPLQCAQPPCGFALRRGIDGADLALMIPGLAPETPVRVAVAADGALLFGATNSSGQIEVWRCDDRTGCNAHLHGEGSRALYGLAAIDGDSVAVLYSDGGAGGALVLAVSDSETWAWRWSTSVPLTLTNPRDSAALHVDAHGEITIGGYTQGSVQTPDGGFAGGGGHDATAFKWDHDGKFLWWLSFAAPESQHISALTGRSSGVLLMAGDAVGPVDFGDGADVGRTFVTARYR